MGIKNKYNFNVMIIVILLIGFVFIIYLVENPITRNIGDLSDWVGSLLTVGTLFMAIKQISNESRLAREERVFQEREKRFSLASPINCYLENLDTIVIINNSTNPIFDIIVGTILIPLYLGHPNGKIMSISEKFPKLSIVHTHNLYRIHHIRPNTEEKINIPSVGGACGKTPWVAMAFQDTKSGYWVREASGELKEINSYAEYFENELPKDIYHFNGKVMKIPRC